MIEIVYSVDCHCGDTATSTTIALDQPEADGRVHIDLEMSTVQLDLRCDSCGCLTGTGDLYLYSPNESDCPGATQDEPEDEDDEPHLDEVSAP